MATKRTATKKAAPAAPAPEPEVIDLVPTDGGEGIDALQVSIVSWFRGLGKFLGGARELELEAKSLLLKAKELTLPTSGDEDLRVQTFIKTVRQKRTNATAYWSITGALSRLHKATVAGRKRAEDPLTEAEALAQNLHNRYTDAERRRAAEEQDRLRREEEQRAREARERELLELEQKALEAEEGSAELSQRERLFVLAYVAPAPSAADAARQAGFKGDHTKAAARLLSMDKIIDAIKAAVEAKELRRQAEAKREEPVAVAVEEVRPDVVKATRERTTYTAEVLDLDRFLEAVIAGGYGIPRDVLQVNQAKLNEYARSLQAQLERWPGIRVNRRTTSY